MKRTHMIAYVLLSSLLLVFQPGCDSDTTASAPQGDNAQVDQAAGPTPGADPDLNDAAPTPPRSPQRNISARIAPAVDEQQAQPAYVVIQNASPTDSQLLVRQLQQVLPATQIVKQVQSTDTREIRLEVSNVRDLRALANIIPFAQVDSIDDRTRTIMVDFDL